MVGRPDDTAGGGDLLPSSRSSRGSGRPADEAQKIAKELKRHWVVTEIGALARPDEVRFTDDNLPKTRSGKIMRRLLRSVANNEPITQDTSTLENPAILDQLSENN